MSESGWTTVDIGDQRDRIALVTGANSGIGFETAKQLAAHGATVVLACRNPAKMADARERLRAVTQHGEIATLALDLADLASIRVAAEEFRRRYDKLDLLINNAGLMFPPYGRTADGFESQFGINHLGHFAITGLLLDRLLRTPGSRVVTVSSLAHRGGAIKFDDLQSERGYRAATSYGQSKLANLLFTYELQRRLGAHGACTSALVAHPGVARTDLTRHSPRFVRFMSGPRARMLVSWAFQDADAGALPILRAATDPNSRGGEYYGPDGWMQLTGRHPVRVKSSARSHDVETQRRLWEESEKLTGVHYDWETAAPDVPGDS